MALEGHRGKTLDLHSGSIGAGQIVAILGEEASTLLAVYAGRLQTEGLLSTPSHHLLVTGAEETVYSTLTVEEHVQFYLHLHSLPAEEIKSRADTILDLLDLSVAKYERVGPHHDGMSRLQRILLASQLVLQPELVLVDDAFRMLGPDDAHAILKSFKRYAQASGAAVVIVMNEHYLLEYVDMVVGVAWSSTGLLRRAG